MIKHPVIKSVALLGLAVFILAPRASAADMSKFNPGNIMSDAVMSNKNTMTEAEIDAFLHRKNSCNNTNLSLADKYPSVQYHIKDGHFVCLADETFPIDYGDNSSSTAPGSEYDGLTDTEREILDRILGRDSTTSPSTSTTTTTTPSEPPETAAHIIYQAAQDYDINPQVLIVLLEKEQSLITDTWPNSTQYRSATGYGCPDTAACDSKYYGFKNQVRQAAALFHSVLSGGWTNYPLGYNYVQYNPNASCGGSVIYINSLATSALYRYTPYQPNAAALAAGYGTGDSCAAYGNRNFYALFTDWFGDTGGGDFTIPGEETAPGPTDPLGSVNETTIKSGTYYLKSTVDTSLAVTVKGASTKNDANIELAKFSDGSEIQQWKLTKQSDGSFTIANAVTKKAIDLDGGKTANGTSAVQNALVSKRCSEKWRVEIVSGTTVYFHSTCDDKKVLDVEDAVPSAGTNIDLLTQNSATSKYAITQQFTLVAVGSSSPSTSSPAPSTPSTPPAPSTETIDPVANLPAGTYFIASALKQSQVVDVQGQSTANAANVHLLARWAKTHAFSPSQRWEITQLSKNYYKIINANSKRALATIGNPVNKTNVQTYGYTGVCNHRWKITRVAKDTYTITSVCNLDLALTAAGNSSANKTNLDLETLSSNSKAQQWIFIKID